MWHSLPRHTGLTWFQRDCSYMPGMTAFKPLNLDSTLTLHLLVTVEPLSLLASIGEKCTFFAQDVYVSSHHSNVPSCTADLLEKAAK